MNPYANNQEVFDAAAKHLLAQGQQAQDDSGACANRTEDGLACAIGGCIPDEVYDEAAEKLDNDYNDLHRHLAICSVDTLIGDYHDEVGWLFDNCDPEFLKSLQMIHDDHTPDQWPDRLEALAVRYGLDPSAARSPA